MLEVLGPLFVIGSIPFWVLAGVYVIFLLWAIDNDSGSLSSVITITFLALLFFMGDLSLKYVVEHPWVIAQYLGGYLLAGVVWSLAKWWFHVNGILRKYTAMRASFMTHYNLPVDTHVDQLTKDLRIRFNEQLDLFARMNGGLPPQSSKNKARIVMWMTYWPASAVWTLINDPVRRIIENLCNMLGTTFQKISDAMFGAHKKDFESR